LFLFNEDRESNDNNLTKILLNVRKQPEDSKTSEAGASKDESNCIRSPGHVPLWNTGNISSGVVISLLVCFFVFSFGFTIIETMATPFLNDQLGIDVENSGILYVIAGVFSAAAFLILLVADKSGKMTDLQATLLSLLLIISGALVLTDFQSFQVDSCQQYSCGYSASSCSGLNSTTQEALCESNSNCNWNQKSCSVCAPVCHNQNKTISIYQVYIGFILFNVQYVLGRICSAAIYSKLLPNKDQAFMQSILMSTGTASRVVAPLLAVAVYGESGYHTYSVTFLVLGTAVLSLIMFMRYYLLIEKALKPSPLQFEPKEASVINPMVDQS
jgi:MFS family permease